MSHGLIRIPSVPHQLFSEVANIDAVLFGDVAHYPALALVLHPSVIAFVDGLLGACCPSAIIRRVVAVIVDSVDRVVWRRLTAHISQKRREAISPLFAHRNASSTIARVFPVASGFNATPAVVLGGVMPLTCASAAVRLRRDASAFLLKASTALCVSGVQIRAKYNLGVAAVASALPFMHAAMRRVVAGHNKTIESLAGQVNQCRHAVDFTMQHTFYNNVP